MISVVVATQTYFSVFMLGLWGCWESTKREVQGSNPRYHCSTNICHDRISLKSQNFNLRLIEPSFLVGSLFFIKEPKIDVPKIEISTSKLA